MGQPQLVMELDSLENLPDVTVPAGYTIRTYREGDSADWCRLISAGIGGKYDEKQFRQSTAGASGFDPQGLFFAERDGLTVGTACAIYSADFPSDMGYLHMVAVDPMHRGHGLGKALTVAVLRRFRGRRFKRAVLQTDDFRLAAIRLYLSLGFRPWFTHESHEARWREVYQELGIPAEQQ
jgi:GNAT superfamily N-acetyltransferase